jgi:hypothetical protein
MPRPRAGDRMRTRWWPEPVVGRTSWSASGGKVAAPSPPGTRLATNFPERSAGTCEQAGFSCRRPTGRSAWVFAVGVFLSCLLKGVSLFCYAF